MSPHLPRFRGALAYDLAVVCDTHFARVVSEADDTLSHAFERDLLNPDTVSHILESRAQRERATPDGVLWRCVVAMLLHSPYPVHVRLSELDLEFLVDCVVSQYTRRPLSGHRGSWTPRALSAGYRPPTKEEALHWFPRKAHPLAGKKANLYLDLVLADLGVLSRGYLQDCGAAFSRIQPGELYDDQACSAVVFAWAAAPRLGFRRACELAIACALHPESGKALSNILKATGNNTVAQGALLCELNVLVGRGVADVDLLADAMRRIGPPAEGMVVCPNEMELRNAVRAIYAEEIKPGVRFQDLDRFWAERYRWCVAGSHSRSANRTWLDTDLLPMQGLPPRLTRRMVSEMVHDNPLHSWDGRVGVSVSAKLEHGKSRALYSCDTRSYYAFTWLLRPVEQAWAGRRVVLDPGGDGHIGMVNRVNGMAGARRKRCYTMLDYSDFNSQHSLRAQQIVISELISHCGLDRHPLAAPLIASFGLMDIYFRGQKLGRVGSTLMSGHRGTSFINSVLNAAYVRIAIGRHEYANIQSLHVGDDVLIVCDDCEHGWRIVKQIESIGCRLQHSKQSVGQLGFEFLRMAGHPRRGVHGYLARSVAGLVSGNWVSDVAMAPDTALRSMVHQARSIINRSGNERAYAIMVSSVCKMTGLDRAIAMEFLSGEVAIAPGPCYRDDGRYCFRYVSAVATRRHAAQSETWLSRLPRYASIAYIEKGCSTVERIGLDIAGTIPWRAMASASYGRMEPPPHWGDAHRRVSLHVSARGTRCKTGTEKASVITTCAVQHGLLAQYPLLPLLKNAFTEEDLVLMLAYLGHSCNGRNPYVMAWGGEGEGVTIRGHLPYTDAAGLAARSLTGTVTAETPVAM